MMETEEEKELNNVLRKLVPPCVCDQVAALTEGLSTDYALVWLFTLMQIFS